MWTVKTFANTIFCILRWKNETCFYKILGELLNQFYTGNSQKVQFLFAKSQVFWNWMSVMKRLPWNWMSVWRRWQRWCKSMKDSKARPDMFANLNGLTSSHSFLQIQKASMLGRRAKRATKFMSSTLNLWKTARLKNQVYMVVLVCMTNGNFNTLVHEKTSFTENIQFTPLYERFSILSE